MEHVHVYRGCRGRASRLAAVGAGARVRLGLGRFHLRGCCSWRPFSCAALVARAPLPVDQRDVRRCCFGRPSRRAAVGAGARLRVGLVHILGCSRWRPHRPIEVGGRERLPDQRGIRDHVQGDANPAQPEIRRGARLASPGPARVGPASASPRLSACLLGGLIALPLLAARRSSRGSYRRHHVFYDVIIIMLHVISGQSHINTHSRTAVTT